MQTWKLFVSLGLCYVTAAQLDTSVCSPTPVTAYTGPQLPDLPDSWTMRVEANLVNKNSTIGVHQWHDSSGNRGAATLWISGVSFTYIFDYANNQQLRLQPVDGGAYVCDVSSLGTADQPYLQGTDVPVSSLANTSHIYSTANALAFAGNISERYVGRGRVRGIVTDSWRGCVYWPQSNATMTVTWYFTVSSGWDTAVGVGAVPVRCEVTGRIHSTTSFRTFQHTYEVTEFYNYLDGGQTVFETPAGTSCPGRRNSQPVPDLPDVFSYSAEVLTVEQQTSQFIKKAYDGQLKLAMLEFTNAAPPYSRLRLIDDFNTGASYTLDVYSGNCTVSTINPNGFDAISTNSAQLRMRTPKEFFFDTDTNYGYEGVRTLRQLNTQVWVGSRLWPPNNPTNTTWEYYFITPDWSESAGLTSSSSMPVSIHVTMGQQQLSHQIYNLYDFADEDTGIWNHDITSCFDDARQFRTLTLAFPVTSFQMQAVSSSQRAFRRALLQTVMTLVPISPVRLNNMQLSFVRNRVDVEVTVVERVTSSVMASPIQEVTLSEVVTRLLQARDTRSLLVNFDTEGGGQHVSLVATASPGVSTTTNTATTPTPTTATTTTPTPTTTTSSTTTTTTIRTTSRQGQEVGTQAVVVCPSYSTGYTPGDMAAVTLGTAIFAYVLSLTSLTLWTRWQPMSLHSFKRERLEMS